MKKANLYDVPRNTTIIVEHLGMLDEKGNKIKELNFKHIDGMFSLCYYKDKEIRLPSTTEVYYQV